MAVVHLQCRKTKIQWMYFEELLTFFFVGVTMAVFSLFFVTFFFRIDLLVGVLFVGCFFAIVLFFHKKKRHEFPLMWKLWHICTPHYFKKKKTSYVFFSGYSVRTYIYEQLRRKRYLSVIFSTFLTPVHLRKVRVDVS